MEFVTMADLSGIPPTTEGVGLIQEEWPVLGPASFYEAGPGAEFVEKAFQGLGQEAGATRVWSVGKPTQRPPEGYDWVMGRRAPYGGKGMPVPYEWTAMPLFSRRSKSKKWLLVGGLVVGGVVLWAIGSALSK